MDSRAVGINKIVPHMATTSYAHETTTAKQGTETTVENILLPETGRISKHVEEILSGTWHTLYLIQDQGNDIYINI